jgi:hypothetical protein
MRTPTLRPDVRVVTTPAGDGRLQVTVGVEGDTLQRLDFLTDQRISNLNAIIDAPAPAQPILTRATAPASIVLPPGTVTYTFYLHRGTAGVTVTQAFSVRLGSGRSVPKFAGGGPSAFGDGGPGAVPGPAITATAPQAPARAPTTMPTAPASAPGLFGVSRGSDSLRLRLDCAGEELGYGSASADTDDPGRSGPAVRHLRGACR